MQLHISKFLCVFSCPSASGLVLRGLTCMTQIQATPLQPLPPGVAFDWMGRPKYPKPQPRFLPQLDLLQQTTALEAQPQWATPPVLLQPTPLPANFNDLPWSERRYWLKMRDEQLKGIRMMEKAAKDQRKAQEKDQQLRQKAEAKQRKRELKLVPHQVSIKSDAHEYRAKEKELKWMRKNPQRFMPIPAQGGYPAATAPAAVPSALAPGPDSLSFMLTSTGEEFGIRRPFNAPGLPRSLGGPPSQAGWPMMSRTMTHVRGFMLVTALCLLFQAVQDLSREERVHAIQVGVDTGMKLMRLMCRPVGHGRQIGDRRS